MDSKTRTNQGGSVLIFTVVAVVMAAALAGAIYIVHQQGNQAQSDTPVFEGADTNTGTADAPGANSEPEEEAPTNSGNGATNDTPHDTSDTATPSLPGTEDDSMPETGTSELPATGPAETLFGLLVIGLLTFGAVSYQRSRTVLQ